MNNFLDSLAAIVGSRNLFTGDQLAERSCGYWNSAPMSALALATPRNTAELSAIMALCHRHNQSVVVQGGMTGLTTGQYSTQQDLALSLEKLNGIQDVDCENRTMTVEAGCTLQEVQNKAAEHGLLFAVDIGARGSCTIGGNISTNAGGMEVLRYGMMREQVLGLEAVLADGTVLSSLNRMTKNNAGFDLKQLFIGTEGTLGIVTRAVLKLRPAPLGCETALIACGGFERLIALLNSAHRNLGADLTRFEVMDGDYYREQTRSSKGPPPVQDDCDWYVLVELCGFAPDSDREKFEAWLSSLLEQDLARDIVISRTTAQRERLWRIRDEFDDIVAIKPAFVYDVSLAVGDMAAYIDQVRQSVKTRWPESRIFILGHMADGNLHAFISPCVEGDHVQLKREADSLVYSPLADFQGSISAEHGIGLDKKPWLHISRSPEEIGLMKELKRLLDPGNILNPGRVIDTPAH